MAIRRSTQAVGEETKGRERGGQPGAAQAHRPSNTDPQASEACDEKHRRAKQGAAKSGLAGSRPVGWGSPSRNVFSLSFR